MHALLSVSKQMQIAELAAGDTVITIDDGDVKQAALTKKALYSYNKLTIKQHTEARETPGGISQRYHRR